MENAPHHPNAYLSKIRNVNRGLDARSGILNTIEKQPGTAGAIANETRMHYSVVSYHLRLLRNEGVVRCHGSKPRIWEVTGLGQTRLSNLS